MANLFTELKRRNVYRVAAAYLVVSWLLLQIGDLLFETLELSEDFQKILLVILAIGFIPAIVFSWVYELTPEGLKKESEITHDESITHITGQRLDYITIIAVVVLIGMMFLRSPVTQILPEEPLTEQGLEEAKAALSEASSIAVLPFEDMSSQRDQEYFGDGIAEELLNVLAQTKGLRVAARTSSFKFKGAVADIPEIGKALNVKTVLEGSIRKSGDMVRITAQLINVEDGYHIWSNTYDRTLDNIFVVQEEIALSIVDALKLKLDITDSRTGTNPEAYDWYLRGRQSSREINKENQLQAVAYYEKALEVDPEFAAAYAGISTSWIWLEDYGGYSADEAFPKIENAARQALMLDSKEPEALMAMGLVYSRVKDDTAVARTMFEYAIELNPSLVEAYTHYADTLAGMGMLKESLKFRKKATVLDPLSTFYRSRLVNHYSSLAAYDEAYKELDEIFKINPEDTYGLEELANIKRQQGEDAEALAAYKKVHDLRPGDAYSASNMATIFEYLGFPEKADRWQAEARLRGEGNRWEITAREELALLRKNAEELLAIADVVEPTDLAIANSLRGFYHYLKKDYATAQEFYQKVFNDPRYNSTSYYNRDHIFAYFSAFIEVMDADNEMPMADVFRRLYKEDGGTENHSVGRPSFSRHMIMACIELSAEQPEVSKEEIYVYLNRAVDNGFKKLSFFEDWPCFEGILDEPEYFTLKARIESLIEVQRVKMQELGL